MSDELKLCPFCGCAAAPSWYGNKVNIHCDNESCPAMNVDVGYLPYNDAVKAWNTRPIEDALQAGVDRLRKQVETTMDALHKIADHSWFDEIMRGEPAVRIITPEDYERKYYDFIDTAYKAMKVVNDE